MQGDKEENIYYEENFANDDDNVSVLHSEQINGLGDIIEKLYIYGENLPKNNIYGYLVVLYAQNRISLFISF